MSTSYARSGSSTSLYRSNYTQPTRAPVVTDDYERWYTEPLHNNRMVLSLLSGLDAEIGWALDRLCRLSHNEQFSLSATPGLLDALFEWPEWFVRKGYKESTDLQSLFSLPPLLLERRQHALESLFVLRNAALHESNQADLASYPRTMPLILNSLHNLRLDLDENNEFLLHTVDLFHAVASGFVLPPRTSPSNQNPLPPLLQLVSQTSNRSLIISTLAALTLLFSNNQNSSYLSSDSPALTASIRYLPLFVDKTLLDASLNYLYVHLSNNTMAKAFLLHPDMPSILRVLFSLLIHEQIEETVTVDVTGAIHTVPSTVVSIRDHELSTTELESLAEMPEPQRCYDWMKCMFAPKPDGEVTQVDFWTLYKDTFTLYQEKSALLAASDVIKNVNFVFPQAQPMVVDGPPQRFIVRGVDRRKDFVAAERLKCRWDRSQCPVPKFSTPEELQNHLEQHLDDIDTNEIDCLWGSCPRKAMSKSSMISHLLTHFWIPQLSERHPSQSDTITLSSPDAPYPDQAPTSRKPPLPRSTVLRYKQPVADPPSSSLTALLCIRILFRTSFVSAEEAPRVDADHFGFPGIVEDVGEDDVMEYTDEGSLEAERKGRRAFVAVKHLMENIHIKDETLMGWITEMIEESST
ncbi:hypothetical protein K435DRAFT_260405 [Dendrothele bispora CBS 962.96]|uniref:RFX-type winged-helix domain-containing protein n=1 Tax=Dendrothele bispora (strain CBS 962.96) TaxID=1314807 RepID=A0A4S8MW46_DENBC|nr:hypothetical protein K435DRAFT_260405 [Dendrothele bispora CBS 962.96]